MAVKPPRKLPRELRELEAYRIAHDLSVKALVEVMALVLVDAGLNPPARWTLIAAYRRGGFPGKIRGARVAFKIRYFLEHADKVEPATLLKLALHYKQARLLERQRRQEEALANGKVLPRRGRPPRAEAHA